MQFYEYPTIYDQIKKASGVGHIDELDQYIKATTDVKTPAGLVGFNQWLCEYDWIKNRRPYYLVYPQLIKYLRKLDLTAVKCDDAFLPITTICFRFAESDDFSFHHEGERYQLKSCVAAEFNEQQEISDDGVTVSKERVFLLWMDFGERDGSKEDQIAVISYKRIVMKDGLTMREAIDLLKDSPTAKMGVPIPKDIVDAIVSTVFTCCLLENGKDLELIKPDVLNKDQRKFEETKDEKYIDRAYQRGKVGWTVGKDLEVNPHYRQGHLMWLKADVAGRTQSRCVWRKGHIVKRDQVSKLPTDFAGEEQNVD